MPKKVAIVSSSCPPVSAGGVASSHYHLYRTLTQKGFHVRLYTFEDYKVALAEKDVTRVGMSPGLVSTLRRLIGWYFRIVDPSRITYHFADVAVSAWPCMMLNSAIRDFQPDVLILPDHKIEPKIVNNMSPIANMSNWSLLAIGMLSLRLKSA